MEKYRHDRTLGLPLVGFDYECVYACHLGTDDPREFEQHLAACSHILPGVRTTLRKMLAEGKVVVQDRVGQPQDAPGQMEIPGTPKPTAKQAARYRHTESITH